MTENDKDYLDRITREEVLKKLPEQWEHDAKYLYYEQLRDHSAAAAFMTCAAQLRRVLDLDIEPRDPIWGQR